jgi:hypothetical protein
MFETLGKMPKNFALSGKYSRDFFNKNGLLLKIKDTEDYPIHKILMSDCNFDEKDALEIEEFLKPMLEYNPKKRISAQNALKLKWLQI